MGEYKLVWCNEGGRRMQSLITADFEQVSWLCSRASKCGGAILVFELSTDTIGELRFIFNNGLCLKPNGDTLR